MKASIQYRTIEQEIKVLIEGKINRKNLHFLGSPSIPEVSGPSLYNLAVLKSAKSQASGEGNTEVLYCSRGGGVRC